MNNQRKWQNLRLKGEIFALKSKLFALNIIMTNKEEEMEKKICPYCGKEFEPTNFSQKYCSKDCAGRSYREAFKSAAAREKVGKPMKCVLCGKEFIATSVQSKFCSKECQSKHTKSKAKAKRLEMKSKMTCEVCGKPLTEYRSYNYCSKKCMQKAKKLFLKENSDINRQMAKPRRSKKSKGPKLSISEICKLAMEEHLSYGQYVEKYGL